MSEERRRENLPLIETTGEATSEQLELAKLQGLAFGAALQAMKRKTGILETKQVDGYEISVTARQAGGLWHLNEGLLGVGQERLEWKQASGSNAYIMVIVRDRVDGRFVPGLHVQVTVRTAEGIEVGSLHQDYVWHPWLYHYGRNWKLPGDGTYRINIKMDCAKFRRLDRANGRRYNQPVDLDFFLSIITGVKRDTER
ncbi:MAG: iron transporter [Chloroflexota bacterium]